MNKCPRCWENNPAEVHTCTPWYYFTEHDKLEFLAYKIWYIWDKIFTYNVREVIFTPEFMEKYTAHYCFIKGYCQVNNYYQSDMINIFNNLDNPATYLFNLLELWQEKN